MEKKKLEGEKERWKFLKNILGEEKKLKEEVGKEECKKREKEEEVTSEKMKLVK